MTRMTAIPILPVAAALALATLLLAPLAHAAAGDTPANPAKEAAASLLRGDTAQAITLYTEALKDLQLTNDRRGSLLNDRAVAYARSGQAKLALDDFNRAIQLYPEHAATYNNRGNLLLALTLPKEAIRDFDRAVLLAPGYGAAYANRAGAHDRLGETDEAMRDYTRAIELTPQNPVALTGRGRILLGLGRPHSAIRDFTRAAAADARFAGAYRGRASAKLRIGRTDDAIEDFSRAIAFDTGNGELYVLRGHAYLGVRNHASAIRDFARAIEIDPKLAVAHAGKGLGNGYVEAFDEAFADLNKAIELDPKNPVSFAYRAVVYAESGQTDVAAKDVETALKLAAERPEALWARGVIAEAQGRTADAVPDYRRAVALDPELTLAAEAVKRIGADLPDSEDVSVMGGSIETWNLVQRGREFYAVSVAPPTIRVPLDSPGTGQPKLIDWEEKKPPFRGIGVLRFNGGTVLGRTGPQDIELTAIVDLNARTVVAIEPHRLGSRTATWTWEDGKLTVASVDGITDEFNLRPGGSGAALAARRPDGSFIDGTGAPRPQRSAAPSRQKPKTIFDLLFGL